MVQGIAEYFLFVIAGIFVIVNPITTSFVFVSLLEDASQKKKRLVAMRAFLTSTATLFVFGLMGGLIFKVFGISMGAFKIAGGIILMYIAMGMIKNEPRFTTDKKKLTENEISDDVAIIPIAIPFISGPGAIATVMILTTQAPSLYHTSLVFIAILLTTATCYFAMIYSGRLVTYFGETGKHIISKIFGLILMVIAVQFIVNGIKDLLPGIMAVLT